MLMGEHLNSEAKGEIGDAMDYLLYCEVSKFDVHHDEQRRQLEVIQCL